MRENEKASLGALNIALMCAGKDDEAAALYVRRLGDPVERSNALEEMQEYLDPATHTPILRALGARHAAIRARPEVQAAIARVGRVEKQPGRARLF